MKTNVIFKNSEKAASVLLLAVMMATVFTSCTNSDNPIVSPEPEPDTSSSYVSEDEVWTWAYDGTTGVWGNMGYCGGPGVDVALAGNGLWWGATDEAALKQKSYMTNDGEAHGDESMDAYFVLGKDGSISRYAGDGHLISSGVYSFDTSVANEWKIADLHTTAGTILFPYEINSGGNMPTVFEVLYKSDDLMFLTYPDGGAFETLGLWTEATYWRFKKQK